MTGTTSGDLRQRLHTICTDLPGAEKSDPWGGGHDAWKVGGKMFACIGAVLSGVSVKCRDVETAQMLIDTGVGRRAKYFHRSWVNLPDETPDDELHYRVTSSYDLIRAKLPKSVRAGLDERKSEVV